SMASAAKGTLKVNGKDALQMNLFTGQIIDYPDQVQSGKTTVQFNIPPAGSLLLFIADKKQQGFLKPKPATGKTIVKGTTIQTIRPSENTLMIDFCDLQFGNTLMKDTHVGMASRTVFRHYG